MNPPECIARVVQTTSARVGLSVINASGAPGFGLNEGEAFAQASAIKVPILWTLHRLAVNGELSLGEALPIDPTNGAGGCGVLQRFSSPNTRVALGDLAVAMIVLSDNVATNLLIDRLGLAAINELIEEMHGEGEIFLRRKMMDQAARNEGRENTATPSSAAVLMLRLAEHVEAGDPAAIAAARVLEMKKESPVTAALGGRVQLATKPGMLQGLRTEWSIVKSVENDTLHHYAMALMADGGESDDELQALFQNLAAAIHEHQVTGD